MSGSFFELDEAQQRLEQIRVLLLSPSAKAVDTTNKLAEEAQALIGALSQKIRSETALSYLGDAEASLTDLKKSLRIIHILAQGAAQVHLGRMRWIWEATQTYTPGGGLANWQPEPRQIDSKG